MAPQGRVQAVHATKAAPREAAKEARPRQLAGTRVNSPQMKQEGLGRGRRYVPVPLAWPPQASPLAKCLTFRRSGSRPQTNRSRPKEQSTPTHSIRTSDAQCRWLAVDFQVGARRQRPKKRGACPRPRQGLVPSQSPPMNRQGHDRAEGTTLPPRAQRLWACSHQASWAMQHRPLWPGKHRGDQGRRLHRSRRGIRHRCRLPGGHPRPGRHHLRR